MILNEKQKNEYWDEFYNNKKLYPVGVTRKRLDKLKSIVWNDNKHFWFWIWRKPEDIAEIIHGEMMHQKIYIPK